MFRRPQILQANGYKGPRALSPGQQLIIPPPDRRCARAWQSRRSASKPGRRPWEGRERARRQSRRTR
jgi:hypothetical protein